MRWESPKWHLKWCAKCLPLLTFFNGKCFMWCQKFHHLIPYYISTRILVYLHSYSLILIHVSSSVPLLSQFPNLQMFFWMLIMICLTPLTPRTTASSSRESPPTAPIWSHSLLALSSHNGFSTSFFASVYFHLASQLFIIWSKYPKHL